MNTLTFTFVVSREARMYLSVLSDGTISPCVATPDEASSMPLSTAKGLVALLKAQGFTKAKYLMVSR